MKTKITYIKSLLAAMVVLAAWMMPQTAWADNVITLGESGGATSTFKAPINYFYKYSYNQQLYTRAEMNGKAQLIKKISFYYDGTGTSSGKSSVKLYMGNTSKTSFDSDTDFVPFSDLVEVYSGSFNCTVGWNEITLSTPFAYNGVGSLVVVFDDNTGSYQGSNQSTFRHASTNSDMTLYNYSDDTNIDPSSADNRGVRLQSRVATKFITEDIQIVDNGGEYLTTFGAPVNNFYNYSYTQQLYTKDELGGKAVMIDRIYFYYAYGSPTTVKNNVVMYMGHKSASSFSSKSDYLPLSSLTQVYSGHLNCKQGWNVFTLSTPFLYNGSDNLVVAVDDNSGAYSGNSYTFRHQKTSDSKTLVYYNDTNNPDPSSSSLGTFYNIDILNFRVLTGFTTSAAPTYTLTTGVNSKPMGSVSGGGTYTYYTTVKLTATPTTGYKFVKWNDGVTTNPRTETVTGNKTYTATFELDKFEIAVKANNTAYGSVSGGGTYDYNSKQTIKATPATGYHFESWSDGTKTYKAGDSNCVTDANGVNQLTITVPASQKTYTATFAPNKYQITVETSNEAYGSVSGGGRYDYNTKHTITATPATGYHFESWNDGNTNASREITVKGTAAYTATFAINTYTIKTASNDPAKGTVSAGGTATYNSELTLEATAKEGYYFKQWNDGNFDNPRTVKYTGNVTYTATFVAPAPFDKTALIDALKVINNKGTAFTLTFDYTTPESYEGTPVSAGDNLRIFYTGTSHGKAHYTVAPSYSGGPIIAPADCMGLFNGLGKMTSIEFNNFNTENVTEMSWMFGSCETLTTLDLSNFNTAKVTNMDFMFLKCPNLRTITVGKEFTTKAVTNSVCMFDGCTQLVGGKGTTYNDAFIDKSYAHVDGGKSNPGYFTSSEYTIVDLALLIRAVKQGESVSDLPFADVDGDGELDLNDIEVLRKILLEIIGKTTETLPGDGNEPTPDDNGNFNADAKGSTFVGEDE